MVLGIWSGKPNVGNIIGYYLGNLAIHDLKLGWELAYIISCSFTGLMTLIILFFLEPYPEKLGINIEGVRKLRGVAERHLPYYHKEHELDHDQ